MSILDVIVLLGFQFGFGCFCFLAGAMVMFRHYRPAIKAVIAESVKENSTKPNDGGGH